MSEKFHINSELSLQDLSRQFLTDVGRQALFCYQETCGEQSDLNEQRMARMTDILQAFGGEILPKSIYDAVMLYESTAALDFSESNSPEVLQFRSNLLQDYFTRPELSETKKHYVASVLGDLNFMDNEANSYRSSPNAYGNFLNSDSKHIGDIIKDAYQNGIETADWDVRAERIDLNRMKGVLRQVNLESVMIKAAQLLDDLHNNRGHSDVAIFHKIAEAESFYAPICEIIGLDGFATSLRDSSLQIRYEKMGRYDILDRARELYEMGKNYGPEKVIGLISQASDNQTGYIVEQMAGKRLNGQDIINTGDFLSILSDKMPFLGGVYRIKTIGSLADKIYRNSNYLTHPPMDALAYSFVVDNDVELQFALTEVLDRLKQSADAELQPTVTKKHPVFIQGELGRTQRIAQYLKRLDIAADVKSVDQNSFQSARVTFVVKGAEGKGIGVEIQFLTVDDRRQARIGSASHVLYKLGKNLAESEVEEITDFMAEIYDRKKYMTAAKDALTTNRNSFKRVENWTFGL